MENIDTEIALLEYRMDRIVELKDEAAQKLQSMIEDADEKAYKLRRLLKWYESYLEQLRQERELVEIACHRELLALHGRLQKLKR